MDDVLERPVGYDPFSREAMDNPLPIYSTLRRDYPVLYLPKYDAFAISRFEDVFTVLTYVDNSFLTSEMSLPPPARLLTHNAAPPPPPPKNPFPLAQNFGMPLYGEVRRAHAEPLRPRAMPALGAWVGELTDRLLDRLLPRGTFDLTAELGGVVSASVMMRLMGMPIELAETALALVNAGTTTDPEMGGFDALKSAEAMVAFYLPYVEARMARADGGVPLIDGLVRYRMEGRALNAEEIAWQLICAFIGGIETVPKVAAHGLLELNARDDQMARVRADPAMNVPRAVEEMLRFCAPAQWFMRTVHKPVTVAGQPMRPGQRVFLLIASALRDEREFDAPEEFRWDRGMRRVLSFGYGVHHCTGLHLARMELREIVSAFLRRVPRFSFDMTQAHRQPSSFQWGWNRLPVVIG